MSRAKIQRWIREYGQDSDVAARARLQRHLRELEAMSQQEIAALYQEIQGTPEFEAAIAELQGMSDEAIAAEFRRILHPD